MRLWKPICQWLGILGALACVAGALAWYDCRLPFSAARPMDEKEAQLRASLVSTAQSYLGTQEGDSRHKAILQQYNTHQPLAQNYTVTETDSWCSAFVSSMAIQAGLTEILPTECGCQRHIGLFQALGRWQEQDTYVPQPGDLIFYDWDQWKPGDGTGWADHVGIVVGVRWPFIQVIEGNRSDSVCYHYVLMGHPNIRGFALPDYGTLAGVGKS